MIKHLKLKLLVFTFLCSSPLYSMEREERASPPIPKSKLSNKRDKDSQGYTEIEKLLNFQLKSKIDYMNTIEKKEDLERIIQDIKNSLSDQHIFLLSVNCATAGFEGEIANHLVGIQISKNQAKCTINYIDPTGYAIPQHIRSLFQENFNNPKIELCNSSKKIQILEQTYDDQAIFLTYLLKLLKKHKPFPAIENLPEFSKCLRKIFQLEIQIPDLTYKTESEEAKNLLVEIFGKLGKLYIKVGDATEDASHYNEAALFYNYVLSMFKNNEHLKSLNHNIQPYDQLNSIQSKLVKCIGGDDQKLEKFALEEFAPYKHLTKLRKDVKEKIKCIDKNEETYIEKSRGLLHEIADGMKYFLAKLYIEAENIVGKAPCDYAVIGLGSMALKQMTPYSDLEFAILISDENNNNYFKKLTELVHFWVINLGETVIPKDKYGCDMDHFVKQGVTFDLGGKTPLGRFEGYKPYNLICTVAKMFEYMCNEDNKSEHIDKTLPYILQKTCLVHGSPAGKQDLFDPYNRKATEFLGAHGEARALKMLSEGCVEIDYANNSGKEHKILGYIQQFGGKLWKSSGKIFNIKEEIYRVPDRFIYTLGLLYGIDSEDSWDTITQLAEQGIINRTAETNLKQALTFATLLRVKVYSHYGYQTEEMDWGKYNDLDQEQSEKLIKRDMAPTFKLSHEDLQENGAFYKYYYTTIPLNIKLHEFCDLQKNIEKPEKSVFFKRASFDYSSIFYKAQIHKRLSKLNEYVRCMEQALPEFEKEHGKDTATMGCFNYDLAGGYWKLKNYEKAIEYFEKAGKTPLAVGDLCEILTCLGDVYAQKGDYQKSYDYYSESLKKQKQNNELFTKNNPNKLLLIQTYSGLGNSLIHLNNVEEGLKSAKKSLSLYEKMVDKGDSSSASFYNTHGVTLMGVGKEKDASLYFNKALELYKASYHQNHPDIAAAYTNIGNCYKKHNPDKALKNYQKALKIWEKNPEIFHNSIIAAYREITSIYRDRKSYSNALNYCHKSLNILEKQSNKDYPLIANIYTYAADICHEMLDYKKELYYYQKILNILEENPNTDYPHIGKIYTYMAKMLKQLGYKSKAEYLEKTSKKIEGNKKDLCLQKSGEADERAANIILAIISDLNWINQHVQQGYKAIRNKIGDLCKKYQAAHDQEIVKMLCFEAICLKIADGNLNWKKALDCLKQFCQENIDLINKIAKLHPEYFLEKEIISKCIKYFPEKLKSLEFLLQEPKLQITASPKFVDNKIENSFDDEGNKETENFIKLTNFYHKNSNDLPKEKKLEKSIIKVEGIPEKRAETLKIDNYIKAAEKNIEAGHLNIAKHLEEIVQNKLDEQEDFTLAMSIDKSNAYSNIKSRDFLFNEESKKKAEDSIKLINFDHKNSDSFLTEKKLERSITKSEEIPEKNKAAVRIVSYNITADFFDNKDKTEDQHHHWHYRAPFVKQLLKMTCPDVMCLQELSPNQAIELQSYFKNFGYTCAFLSQTPSEIETGAIAYGEKVGEWQGKICGTPLIGTFISKAWKFVEAGRFWLNETPDNIPQNKDRGDTDKGFGNMNTYRAVLWTKIENVAQKNLFVFNSHYPLSGDNKTRFQCAKLEMKKIKEITQNGQWVSAGDRNIMLTKNDDTFYNPEVLYQEFVKFGYDVRDSKAHYGISTSWLGFSYDKAINEINTMTDDFKDNDMLDLIVSNVLPELSFGHHGAIDSKNKELSTLSGKLTEEQNARRYFSSDHALIGGDFIF